MWNVVFCFGVLYVAYVLLGGAIFLSLEGIQRLPVPDPVFQNRSLQFSKIKKILLANNFTDEELTQAVREFFPKNPFGFFTFPIFQENFEWTFFNAFFFSYKMLATMGYGGITPTSFWQKFFCLLYCLFGIPLNHLFARVLAQHFSLAWQEAIFRMSERNMKYSNSKVSGTIIFYALHSFLLCFLPPIILVFTENWSYLEGLYYTCTTLATASLGDYSVGHHMEKGTHFAIYSLTVLLWMFHGEAFFTYTTDACARLICRISLFELDVDFKNKKLKLNRVILDPESLDVHFLLLKAEKGVRADISIWKDTKKVHDKEDFIVKHLQDLIVSADELSVSILITTDRDDWKEKSIMDVVNTA